MPDNLLSFKIKSGLKNIIGKDLITDDYVAVFELVKNSFDAYAKNVTIKFDEDKITISDDGKGMDLPDINDKWLSVAYSAKKEGVEDDELAEKEFDSYRDKIQAKKVFAGAKGIGRFSCDKLGDRLILTSRKATVNSKLEQIEVNWSDFDKNSTDEFIDIKVKHRTLHGITKELKNFTHGTILEIRQLNSQWDRNKKRGLKHSLEKLINPFEENPLNGFSITIIDEKELELDKKEKIKRDAINGEVKNFVFETFKLKTTEILTEIDTAGDFIITSLWDRGTLIYKIRKPNSTVPKLHNIKFRLFFLNHSAKINFKKMMGIDNVNFGSVFLYKNGFRIAPYGDVGFDYFGLDSRKTQKHFDRLGSRDIIGRIEILGENKDLREISSRDGGLVRNDTYQTMVRCFIKQCLEKLENYLNNVQWTNKEDKFKEDLSALENIAAKSELLKLISSELIGSDTQLEGIDKTFVNINANTLLKEAKDEEIANLKIIADKLGDLDYINQTNEVTTKYEILKREKEELEKKLEEQKDAIRKAEEEKQKAEEEKQKAEEEKQKAEEAFERERKKNLFFNATGKDNNRATLGLIHHIKLTSKALNSRIKILTKDVINDKIEKVKTLEILSEIKMYSEKIQKLSEIVSYSDLNFKYEKHNGDIIRFIEEYINEIKSGFPDISFSVNTNNIEYHIDFSILEISIILDNLISNSHKALKSLQKNKKIQIEILKRTDGICVQFSDNGVGLDENSKDHIFDLGFTTTRGSGIGLYMVKDLLTQMGGEILFVGNNKILNGATFDILF